MAFRDFSFPKVHQDLGLSLQEADLFSAAPTLVLREEFKNEVKEGANLALAVNTEKAKSEFIIAPILLELRRVMAGRFGLFSGIELDVDPVRGLNGVCDFLITREPRQFVVSGPLIAIVEAKNDNLRTGLGQCIAAMVAAQLFNQQAGTSVPFVYGAVTTGSAWKFLQLRQAVLTLDIPEYYIDNLAKIMGILKHLVESA